MSAKTILNTLDELIEFLDSPKVENPESSKTCSEPNSIILERPTDAKGHPETLQSPELMKGGAENQFGLISFNCLCRGNVNHDEFDNYRHIQDLSLIDWDNGRRELVLKQLLEFQSELICVQEVECIDFESYLGVDMKKGGYEYIVQNNPHISEAQKMRGNMGCAIFYKPEVFEQIGNAISRSRSVMASFKHLKTSSIIHVLTCHLQGDPKRVKDRFGQMKSNFKYLRKLIKANGEGAIILCGDFNTGRDGAPFQLLSTGSISSEFQEYGQQVVKSAYTSDWKFQDAYEGTEDTPTFFNPFHPCGLVDFIFFRGNLNQLNRKTLYSETQFQELQQKSLPNKWNGSDHVPIGCVLELL